MSQPTDPFPPRDPSKDPALLADLPPVEAPSAGFIVQLFVIPAIVVAVVIVVWLLFGKLAGGERDALSYVETLKSPNANWRAAFELASLIQNDPKLSNDPRLLGALTDLLAHDLDKDDNPKLTAYLALALGAFQTEDAELGGGPKPDPLATLAHGLAAKHPKEVQIAAALSLAKHAARLDGKLSDETTVRALAEASRTGDSSMRQVAVYALGFCGGELVTETLRDRVGHDEDRYTRYNAAIALGRRGDPAALGALREMLSSDALNQLLNEEADAEKRGKIEFLELEALQALEKSLDRGAPDLAQQLRPEVETLSQSGLVSVRNRAQTLLRARALSSP